MTLEAAAAAAATEAPAVEAPVAEVPAAEAPATPEGGKPAVEAPVEVERDVLLEVLDPENPIAWIKTHEENLRAKGEESFKISKAELDALSPAAQKLVVNLRGVVTRRAQKLAETEKTLAEKAKKQEAQRRLTAGEKGAIESIFTEDGLKLLKERFAKPEEGAAKEPEDRYSPEWLEWTADTKARDRAGKEIVSFFTDIVKQVGEEKTAHEKAETDRTKDVRTTKLRAFIAEHDDFATHRPQIKDLFQKHAIPAEIGYALATDEHAKAVIPVVVELVTAGVAPERAHRLARLDLGLEGGGPSDVELARDARLDSQTRSVGGGKKPRRAVKRPTEGTLAQKDAWFQAHPEEADAFLAEKRRTGNSL